MHVARTEPTASHRDQLRTSAPPKCGSTSIHYSYHRAPAKSQRASPLADWTRDRTREAKSSILNVRFAVAHTPRLTPHAPAAGSCEVAAARLPRAHRVGPHPSSGSPPAGQPDFGYGCTGALGRPLLGIRHDARSEQERGWVHQRARTNSRRSPKGEPSLPLPSDRSQKRCRNFGRRSTAAIRCSDAPGPRNG
jgi:hypothetical protein